MTTERGPFEAAQQLHYQRAGRLTIQHEESMVVSAADWKRIRRNAEGLGDPLVANASTWASCAVGAAIGLVGTVISLVATESDPAPGVIACLIVAAVFCVLFAICFGVIGSKEKQRYGLSSQALCEDMDDVERRSAALTEGE